MSIYYTIMVKTEQGKGLVLTANGTYHDEKIKNDNSTFYFFFFNDTAPTKISPLPLPDPLPIWLRGIGVEVDARGLAQADAPDLSLGHERSQIALGQVHERDDGGARRDHLARLGRARRHRPGERRGDAEIFSVGARLFERGSRALGLGLRGGDARPRLQELPPDRRGLGGATGPGSQIRLPPR